MSWWGRTRARSTTRRCSSAFRSSTRRSCSSCSDSEAHARLAADRPGGARMNQQEIVQGIKEERERLIDFLASLPDGQWNHDTLCEGWRVRDVVSHLVGNLADVLDQNFEGLGSPEHNQAHIDARAAKTPKELLD